MAFTKKELEAQLAAAQSQIKEFKALLDESEKPRSSSASRLRALITADFIEEHYNSRDAQYIREMMGQADDSMRIGAFRVGAIVLVRTVSYHSTGIIVDITASDFTLARAAWIANTGRYHRALIDGIENDEGSRIEPIPDGMFLTISRFAYVDISASPTLPRETK